MDFKNVDFVWASDLLNSREYWKTVMQIARTNTVKRIVRCAEIMGRSESESMQASQIIYPCMQCADIFHLKAEITSHFIIGPCMPISNQKFKSATSFSHFIDIYCS